MNTFNSQHTLVMFKITKKTNMFQIEKKITLIFLEKDRVVALTTVPEVKNVNVLQRNLI